MDPASSFLVGHVSGKLLDKLGASFRTHVVERWSRRRAEAFFDEFCRELSRQKETVDPDHLDRAFTNILEDEGCSEVLFDAYRRVAFSKSRELGPRIIALLTAEIVVERRVASDVEEAMFLAAENLTDDDLKAFAAFVRDQSAKAANTSAGTQHGLNIKWHHEQFDSNWRRGDPISTAPLDLEECLGRWAAKLKLYGIVSDDVREREFNYEADSERHIDERGTVREVTWWISVSTAYFKFAELIERVVLSASIDRSPVY